MAIVDIWRRVNSLSSPRRENSAFSIDDSFVQRMSPARPLCAVNAAGTALWTTHAGTADCGAYGGGYAWPGLSSLAEKAPRCGNHQYANSQA